MITTLIILFLLLLLSSIFSGAETALFMVGRDRNLLSAEQLKHGKDSSILSLLKDPSRLLMSLLLGNLLVNMSFFAFSTLIIFKIEKEISASAGFLASLVSLLLVIIFGEILPKTIASVIPLPFSRCFAWFIYRLNLSLNPIIHLMEILINSINRIFKIDQNDHGDKIDVKHLVELVNVGESTGWLMGIQGELMETLIKLKHVRLMEITIPRVDVQSCSLDSSVAEVLQNTRSWGREWMPLYQEHHDDVAYYVDCVKLLGLKDVQQSVKPFATKLKVFSELARMDLVLRVFLEEELPLALVVDEFGEMAGMVTWDGVMKSLRRKLNIIHDSMSKDVAVQILSGRTKISRLEFLALDYKGDSVTLSGYLIDKFDGIPEVGAVYETGSASFMVLRADEKGIKEVMFSKTLEKIES